MRLISTLVLVVLGVDAAVAAVNPATTSPKAASVSSSKAAQGPAVTNTTTTSTPKAPSTTTKPPTTTTTTTSKSSSSSTTTTKSAAKPPNSSSTPPPPPTTPPASTPSSQSTPSSISFTTGSESGTTLSGTLSLPLSDSLTSTSTSSTETIASFPSDSSVASTATQPPPNANIGPTSVPDNSGSASFLRNRTATALVFTFVGILAVLSIAGVVFILRKRIRDRRPVRLSGSDMDYRGFRRANSSTSSTHGPTSSRSSTRFSGVPPGAEDIAGGVGHYQPQRLHRNPTIDMATLMGEAPLHRAIYPDILPPRAQSPAAPRQQFAIYPDILPGPYPVSAAAPRGEYLPRPAPPPPAVRPNSPESEYDEESMYAGIGAHRNNPFIDRRPGLSTVRSGVAM